MSTLAYIRAAWSDFLTSVQFLTRVPVPQQTYEADSLAHALKFFPIVGLLIGVFAAMLHMLLVPHLPRVLVALVVLIFLVCITGCLHEDGLADAADGFGGGWNREQILIILRDSRIGSYGAAALALSLLARLLLISSLPATNVVQSLISAHVLCRWTTLPLSYYLPPARSQSENGADGQGARIARLTSAGSLIAGTTMTFAIVAVTLRGGSIFPILAATVVTLLSAFYYKRRIGGVTGDCFGATNQLAEIAVYFCGVWHA